MALTQAGLNARQTTGTAKWLYMEVGTGASTATLGTQTALVTPLSPRILITSSSVTGAIASFAAMLDNSVSGTLTEVGVYEALTGGDLLSYQLITPPIVKTSAVGRILRISETLANA